MIPTTDQWGPFAKGIDPAERLARCRCLRAVVHLTTSPRGETATRLLQVAEWDPTAFSDAARAFNAMDAPDKRHVWANYARLSKAV